MLEGIKKNWIVAIFAFAIVFTAVPSLAYAKAHMGGRVSINLNPGLHSGVEYGIGADLGWYSDKTWTLINAGGSIAYNPWDESFPMTDYVNVIQGVAKWLALGVSGFIYIPLPEKKVYPGLVGIVDFIIKEFDIALIGGVIWAPKPGPSFGIQFGYNFTVI